MSHHYGYEQETWERAKEEALAILTTKAKRSSFVPWLELVDGVKAIRFMPNDDIFGFMLFEISEAEYAAGRGALYAIVVHREGDKMPGPGFSRLAKLIGKDTSDLMKCWQDEVNTVHDYWSNRHKG